MSTGASYGVAEGILPNPFRTPGVGNIEKRYSAAGGAPNHQPGTSSPLGHPDKIEGNTVTAKGIGTPHHEENYQGQKPDVSVLESLSLGRGRLYLYGYLRSLGGAKGFAACADDFGTNSRVDSTKLGIEPSTTLRSPGSKRIFYLMADSSYIVMACSGCNGCSKV